MNDFYRFNIHGEDWERELSDNGSYMMYEDHKRIVDAMQAKIDFLMLEWCPNEMTAEQFEAWAAAQRSVRKEGLE